MCNEISSRYQIDTTYKTYKYTSKCVAIVYGKKEKNDGETITMNLRNFSPSIFSSSSSFWKQSKTKSLDLS